MFNVQIMSVRQALIPEHLFGRVQGAYRTVIWGGIPLGMLAGGLLGAWLGPAGRVRRLRAWAASSSALAPGWSCTLTGTRSPRRSPGTEHVPLAGIRLAPACGPRA